MDPIPTPQPPPSKKSISIVWAIVFLVLGILIGAGGLWGYQSYVLTKSVSLGPDDPGLRPEPIPTELMYATPTPLVQTTCAPRPACLDSTPSCMIPETEDMCPYTCPSNGWVDCMPGIGDKPECSSKAMLWYQTNCPDFQGGAY